MREIKFRFYDNVNKRFWFGGDEGKSVGEETFQTHFVNGVFTATMFEPISYGFQDVDDYLERELPNSQFTGLKDKNGVEIYEGHIVKQEYSAILNIEYDPVSYGFVDQETEDGHHIGEVVILASKGACLKNPIKYVLDSDETTVSKQYKSIAGYRCEIIGSIYENTELVGENNG